MARWQDQLGSIYGDVVNDLGNTADSIIYGLGFTDDDKQKAKYLASGIPIVGELLKSSDEYAWTSDYLSNRGLSWSDVKYPAKISGQSYGSTMNFVSDNIKRLYS